MTADDTFIKRKKSQQRIQSGKVTSSCLSYKKHASNLCESGRFNRSVE